LLLLATAIWVGSAVTLRVNADVTPSLNMCVQDISKLCSDKAIGISRILCMYRNIDQVSGECVQALESLAESNPIFKAAKRMAEQYGKAKMVPMEIEEELSSSSDSDSRIGRDDGHDNWNNRRGRNDGHDNWNNAGRIGRNDGHDNWNNGRMGRNDGHDNWNMGSDSASSDSRMGRNDGHDNWNMGSDSASSDSRMGRNDGHDNWNMGGDSRMGRDDSWNNEDSSNGYGYMNENPMAMRSHLLAIFLHVMVIAFVARMLCICCRRLRNKKCCNCSTAQPVVLNQYPVEFTGEHVVRSGVEEPLMFTDQMEQPQFRYGH